MNPHVQIEFRHIRLVSWSACISDSVKVKVIFFSLKFGYLVGQLVSDLELVLVWIRIIVQRDDLPFD